MEEKIIHKRYSYYFEYLQRMGRMELEIPPKYPTIENLKLSRGAIQAAYKEMEKDDFKGSIINYLCYVSTLYIANLINKKNLKNVEKVLAIINLYAEYKEDTVNLLRLFNDNPLLVLNEIVDLKQYEDPNINYFLDKHKMVMILSSAWYQIFTEKIWTKDGKMTDKIFNGYGKHEPKFFNMFNKLIDS